jgi:hypothetical protein
MNIFAKKIGFSYSGNEVQNVPDILDFGLFWLAVFNATFNNISVISWR